MKKNKIQNSRENFREVVKVKLPGSKITGHKEPVSKRNIENPILNKTIKRKKSVSSFSPLKTEEQKTKTPDKTFGFSTFFIINLTLVVVAVIIIIIVLFAGGFIFPS